MVQVNEGYTVKNDNWSHECESATGRSSFYVGISFYGFEGFRHGIVWVVLCFNKFCNHYGKSLILFMCMPNYTLEGK